MATFYNQATLSYNGQNATSNITVGEIRATLAINKNAVNSSYTAGERITYVLNLVNSGSTAFNNLSISDNLGGYTFAETTLVPLEYIDGSVLYYLNGELQTAPAAEAGAPLVFSGINVPAGGNATIIYDAKVNEYAPLNLEGTVTNTVAVSGGGLSSELEATHTVAADTAPSLGITKSLNPTVVPENGQLTYTFVLQNTGRTAVTAEGDAVLTDVFDPVLDITAVTFNGTTWTETSDYTYDSTSGTFATVAGKITVPAATAVQNATTGVWSITPGTSTLTVTGNV